MISNQLSRRACGAAGQAVIRRDCDTSHERCSDLFRVAQPIVQAAEIIMPPRRDTPFRLFAGSSGDPSGAAESSRAGNLDAKRPP